MTDGNGNKFISWKIWAGILGTVVFMLVGIAIASVQSDISKAHTKIEQLQDKKVDWDQYRCDMRDIKDDLGYIRRKMDKP